MIEVAKISGIGGYTEKRRKILETGEEDRIFLVDEGEEKAFLVIRPKTIEVRSDRKLSEKLKEKYETVMESRYFGKGGVEIVPCGQLEESEIEDLIRLSYNLTKEGENKNR